MRSTLFAFLALFVLPLGACNLYFGGGGDDPDPCEDYADWGGPGQRPEPAPLLRNPETGICESFGWTEPPFPCDGVCGPCAGNSTDGTGEPLPPGSTDPQPEGAEAPAELGDQANPSWGYCDSFCTGLDEQSCLGTAGCRGIYDSDGGTGANQFLECWQTDFSGPPLVQSCEGLDAYTCSQLDSCIAVHDFTCNTDGSESGLIEPPCEPGYFIACHDEQPTGDGCYSDAECGTGFSCNADTLCLPPPPGDAGPCPDGCDVPAVCYGYCVPDNTDPGQCDGVITCDILPPLCEAGTTPGIGDNGCYTGQCIDLSLCPQATCSDIVGESMCIARSDCSPYYVGVDCSCTPDGCDCSSWNFDSCNPQ